ALMKTGEQSAPEGVPGMSSGVIRGGSPGAPPVLTPVVPLVAPYELPGASPVRPLGPGDEVTVPASAEVRMTPPAPPPPGPKESDVGKVAFVPAPPLAWRLSEARLPERIVKTMLPPAPPPPPPLP